MIEQSMLKIKTEMEQNSNNSYIQAVGGMLLQHLNVNQEVAERILAEGKTISGSLTEMRKEAEKKKVGNCAVLTDQEGFAIVLKYFGIDAVTEIQPQPVPAQAVAAVVREKPSANFNVSLDDLLSEL